MNKLISKITGILTAPFLFGLFYFLLEKFIYSVFVVRDPNGVTLICWMTTMIVAAGVGIASITHFEKEGE